MVKRLGKQKKKDGGKSHRKKKKKKNVWCPFNSPLQAC